MSQSERSKNAVLLAAIELVNAMPEAGPEKLTGLVKAVEKLQAIEDFRAKLLHRDPSTPPCCPHCYEENPPFGFNLGGGDLGLIGQVQYLTPYCGHCGCILPLHVTAWQPTEQLMAAFEQKRAGKPRII